MLEALDALMQRAVMSEESAGRHNRWSRALMSREDERCFGEAFNRLLQSILDVNEARLVNLDNKLKLKHGESWSFPALTDSSDSSFYEMSSLQEVKIQDIVDGNLSIIPRLLNQVASELGSQFEGLMIGVMSKAADSNSNVVTSIDPARFPEAFLDALRKIQLSVDPDGGVAMPQVLMPPGGHELIKQLEQASPELLAEIEAVKAAKAQEARDAEAKRKLKFRRDIEK